MNFRLALTKLDVLDNFEEIKAAVGYKLDGHSLLSPPCKLIDRCIFSVIFLKISC